MGKKLYVGNLGYNVRSSDLEQLFSQFGSVQSAQVITDRDTGRGKGFGFVEMSNEAEANAAINGLNEQEHEGRRLTVNEAKPRLRNRDRLGKLHTASREHLVRHTITGDTGHRRHNR